ncbi:MAG: HEAT repeat domain-containing protein [Deltaproteobacteria bacterium]|nr:HEAT repeat domain-containing protein [Deltaproteobacteria bacterium]
MKKNIIPIGSILAGLLISHAVAFLQVYISNERLYARLHMIESAGYLPAPNRFIMSTLQDFGSAFFGGLFFTLTVGAALILLSLGLIWIWGNIFKKNRIFFIPVLILWAGTLLYVNLRGFCPIESAYFILVPITVIITSRSWRSSCPNSGALLNSALVLIPFILLIVVWSTVLNGNLFINIRDYLLLNNPVGIKINDFYYRYTLYPAEVIKPLRKKTLKTCSISNILNKSELHTLESSLLNRDYLILDAGRGELNIEGQGHLIIFKIRGREVIRGLKKDFILNPDFILNQLSDRTDKHMFFRSFIYFSIFSGFPLLLYLLILAGLQYVLHFIKQPKIVLISASCISLFAGIALFLPVYTGVSFLSKNANIADAIQSGKWQDNLWALKIVCEKRLDIMDYQGWQDLSASPHISVRYWFARALGVSRRQNSCHVLVSLLDDHHPNVVCQALTAIKLRGCRSAADIILSKMKKSNHWYIQTYAYSALRGLGWKQTKYQ